MSRQRSRDEIDPPPRPLFVCLWGSGYVVGALALQVSGPLPLLVCRFLLAALIVLPFALRGGRRSQAPIGR